METAQHAWLVEPPLSLAHVVLGLLVNGKGDEFMYERRTIVTDGLSFAELTLLPKAPLITFLTLQNGGYFVAFTATRGGTDLRLSRREFDLLGYLAEREGRIVQRVTSLSSVIASVRSGIGAALLPSTIGDHLKGVVRVTPPIPELTTPCWLVTTDQARRQPHIRAVIDCVTDYVVSHARVQPPEGADPTVLEWRTGTES